MLLESILICLVIILSWFYWKQSCCKYAQMLNAFPGPRSYPIAGNLIGRSIKPDVLFNQVRKVIQPFDQTFRTWNSIVGGLNIITADDAKIILSQTTEINKGPLYFYLLKPWLHNGLLTSTEKLWHHRRKMLTPAFHLNILRKFVDVFAEHSETLIESLKHESGNPKTDVVPLMSQITLASICDTSMGLKIDPENEAQKEYFDCLHRVAPFLIQRAFSPWLLPPFIYFRTNIYKRFKAILNILHKFSSKVIQEREEDFHEDDVKIFDENENIPGVVGRKKLALLDLLISQKRSGYIDDDGIREEVDTFIFAGHDTTAVTACFALMLLANHKQIQEAAKKEVDDVFGGSSRRATYEDLLNMKYLDRCIKETLRLYPSVPAISRYLEKDIKLTHHIAPRNTIIFVHIYNIHRDPNVYPDPEKFDPDRFLPENCKKRSSYEYIPFSAGPRNCIGQKFAMLELKTIISSILRYFTLEPVDSEKDITLMVDLVLRMKNPLHVKFNPRY